MTDANREQDYALDEDIDDVAFNPLEDFSFEDDIDDEDIVATTLDDGPYGLPVSENAPQFKLDAFDNAESADERIATLFDRMAVHKRVLMNMLEMCQSPVSSDELIESTAQLQKHHHSVYTPLTFCNLLERAGAVIKTDENGTSLEEVEQEPLRVERDGVEYWAVAPSPEVFWCATDEGRAYYAAYQPLEQIRQVFAAEPHYKEIFTTVLNLCSVEGGTQVKAVGDVVDDDPLVQKPRRYAMYFIDKLERAGALDWQGSWVITDAGKSYLAEINTASEMTSEGADETADETADTATSEAASKTTTE